MALLLVDLQLGTCGDAQPRPRPAFDAQFRAHTLPAAQRALAAARRGGLEVIHTVIANLTADGRLDYGRCGMGFAPGSRATQVIAELAPWPDELVLSKSSSSPFSSTSLDYLLRNIGIRTLVVMGLLTDQCIDHTVKDAADRGYRVVCLSDACQAETPERHAAALACFQGYCTQIPVAAFEAQIMATLLPNPAAPPPPSAPPCGSPRRSAGPPRRRQVGHRRGLPPPQAGGEIGELVPQGPEHPSTGFGSQREVRMMLVVVAPDLQRGLQPLASCQVAASGFSTNRCRPQARAALAWGPCWSSGVASTTASRLSSAISSRASP